jgi:hypothetical protein
MKRLIALLALAAALVACTPSDSGGGASSPDGGGAASPAGGAASPALESPAMSPDTMASPSAS